MGKTVGFVTNKWFRSAVDWLNAMGKELTDQRIAKETGFSYQQISNYRCDRSKLSGRFIKKFEEIYLSEFDFNLENFENVASLPPGKLTEEQGAVVMINTKVERTNATLDILLEKIEEQKNQLDEQKKQLNDLTAMVRTLTKLLQKK